MSTEEMRIIRLTSEQWEFLKQTLNADNLAVALKNAQVAAEVFQCVMSAPSETVKLIK